MDDILNIQKNPNVYDINLIYLFVTSTLKIGHIVTIALMQSYHLLYLIKYQTSDFTLYIISYFHVFSLQGFV